MTLSSNRIFPIKSKSAYIKILFLKDQLKFADEPFFLKPLRGSLNELKPIYDTGIFYFFTRYGSSKPERYNWELTSEQGTIDDIFQLYPFETFDTKEDFQEAAKRNKPDYWGKYLNAKDEGTCVIATYYNAFQRGKEWAGVRAENNIGELRLIVDFSLIATYRGKENLLFNTKPKAYLRDQAEGIEKSINMEYSTDRIFSAMSKNVSGGQVLLFKWKIDWENLANWKAFSESNQIFQPVTPGDWSGPI